MPNYIYNKTNGSSWTKKEWIACTWFTGLLQTELPSSLKLLFELLLSQDCFCNSPGSAQESQVGTRHQSCLIPQWSTGFKHCRYSNGFIITENSIYLWEESPVSSVGEITVPTKKNSLELQVPKPHLKFPCEPYPYYNFNPLLEGAAELPQTSVRSCNSLESAASQTSGNMDVSVGPWNLLRIWSVFTHFSCSRLISHMCCRCSTCHSLKCLQEGFKDAEQNYSAFSLNTKN